jgi:hypothetical protein
MYGYGTEYFSVGGGRPKRKKAAPKRKKPVAKKKAAPKGKKPVATKKKSTASKGKYCALSKTTGRCHKGRAGSDSKFCESRVGKGGRKYCGFSALGRAKGTKNAPSGCQGRSKTDCEAPCNWVKGKCTSQNLYNIPLPIPGKPKAKGAFDKVPPIPQSLIDEHVAKMMKNPSKRTKALKKAGIIKSLKAKYRHTGRKLVYLGIYERTQANQYKKDLIMKKVGSSVRYVSKAKAHSPMAIAMKKAYAELRRMGIKGFVPRGDRRLESLIRKYMK